MNVLNVRLSSKYSIHKSFTKPASVMTHGFGEIPVRIRRIAYYTLTAWEQRYWVNFMSQQVPSFFRGARELAIYMGPALVIGIATVKWAPEANRRYNRKDPKLYENDKKSTNQTGAEKSDNN